MKIYHSGPSVGFFDDRYVNITGDTMTGTLTINPSSGPNALEIGDADVDFGFSEGRQGLTIVHSDAQDDEFFGFYIGNGTSAGFGSWWYTGGDYQGGYLDTASWSDPIYIDASSVDIQKWANNPFNVYGNTTIQPANSATAVQINQTDGTNVLTVDTTNARVGIGTATPATKLDIDSNSNTQCLRLRGTAETTEIADLYVTGGGGLTLDVTAGNAAFQYIDLRTESDAYGIIIRESDGTGTTTWANLYVVDAADDYLAINVNSAQDADALVVSANNNVGIGRVPTTKLDVYVNTNAAATSFHLLNASTGNASLVQALWGEDTSANFLQMGRLSSGHAGVLGLTASDCYLFERGASGDMIIGTGDATSGNFKVYIKGLAATNQMLEISNTTMTLGAGAADVDYVFAVTGQTNSGQFKWMEDEDYFQFDDDLKMADSENIVFGTSTGSQIGTATGQMLGFWGVTPVVQQVLATGGGASVDDVIGLLQTLGLCKQS